MNIHKLFPFLSSLLIALWLAGCSTSDGTGPAQKQTQVVLADVLTAAPADVFGAYDASGTVHAALHSDLSSKVTSRVSSVLVHEGQTVKQGQLLVKLDSREMDAAVRVAEANFHASVAGVGSASSAAIMEDRTSAARISQAISHVAEAQAALRAAESRRDLVVAGPRFQELEQTHLTLQEAESNLRLASKELERTSRLVDDGALARRELDLAQNRYDVAKGQRDIAIQAESIARQGSREQEVRAANDTVSQARASLIQARAAALQSKAAALEVRVKQSELAIANTQVEQTKASLQSAQVVAAYSEVRAPFDGTITHRSVDPGALASPGSPLLTIESRSHRIEFDIPETALRFVPVGKGLAIRFDALDRKDFPGTVSEISPKGDLDSHGFVVKVELPKGRGIESGMYGKASVPTTMVKRVLIPESATWEQAGLHYIFAVDLSGFARLRIVTLGEHFDQRVEILSGLSAGERFLAARPMGVTEGTKVEAKQR